MKKIMRGGADPGGGGGGSPMLPDRQLRFDPMDGMPGMMVFDIYSLF